MNIAKFITTVLLTIIYISALWLLYLNTIKPIEPAFIATSVVITIIGEIVLIIGIVVWLIENWKK